MSSMQAVVSLALIASSAWAHAEVPRQCSPSIAADPCGDSPDPLTACRETLEKNRYRLATRITLCDVYVQQDELVDAIVLIEEGLNLCNRNSYSCGRLKIALSQLHELEAKQTPDTRAQWAARLKARRAYCLRLSQFDAAIEACNQALVAYPDDAELHLSLARKYRLRGFTALALVSYRNSRDHGAREDVTQLMAEVELERQQQIEACLNGQELPSCDTAVLAGAEDGFDLQRKRGELLLVENRFDAAREALLIAQAIRPTDVGAARRLLEFLDEGSVNLQDPAIMTARAYALLATGQEWAALVARRRIPESYVNENIEQQGAALFVRAEREREIMVTERCLRRSDESALGDCEILIFTGLPDEIRIRDHIAILEKSIEDRRLAKLQAERVAEAEARIASVDQSIDQSVDQIVAEVGAQAVAFSNRANDGVTH